MFSKSDKAVEAMNKQTPRCQRRPESPFLVWEYKEESEWSTESLSQQSVRADRLVSTSGVRHNRHLLQKEDYQQSGHCVTRAAVNLPEPLLSLWHSRFDKAGLGDCSVIFSPGFLNTATPLFPATEKALYTILNNCKKATDKMQRECGKECG